MRRHSSLRSLQTASMNRAHSNQRNDGTIQESTRFKRLTKARQPKRQRRREAEEKVSSLWLGGVPQAREMLRA